MNSAELEQWAAGFGYLAASWNEETQSINCVIPYMFSYGLAYGCNDTGIGGRYCYKDPVSALLALQLTPTVSLTTPPSDLAFIKHKGKMEWTPSDLEAIYMNSPDVVSLDRRELEFLKGLMEQERVRKALAIKCGAGMAG